MTEGDWEGKDHYEMGVEGRRHTHRDGGEGGREREREGGMVRRLFQNYFLALGKRREISTWFCDQNRKISTRFFNKNQLDSLPRNRLEESGSVLDLHVQLTTNLPSIRNSGTYTCTFARSCHSTQCTCTRTPRETESTEQRVANYNSYVDHTSL